jgi:hypothetical protein
MDWWSDTILGDPPLDFLHWIGDRVFAHIGHERAADLLDRAGRPPEVANEPPSGSLIWPPAPERSELHAAVRKALGSVAVPLSAEFGEEPGTSHIALQALAVAVMAYGARMSAELRRMTRQAAFGDEWARQDPGRRARVAQLVAAIDRYEDGKPLLLEEVSLAEAIGRHLAAGKEGLVNTGPGLLP